MSRPPIDRRIENIPDIKLFKPAGIPGRDLSEVCLTLEEVEAIRLKDLEGLFQAECAEKMNVSRPTFQRILSSAREKIASALLGGKAIRFQGGNYHLASPDYYCNNCQHEFKLNGKGKGKGKRHRHGNRGITCPECGNEDVVLAEEKE